MNARNVPDGLILRCAECNSTALRRSWMQKYCPDCSAEKDTARKRAHKAKVGDTRSPERRKRDYEAHKQALHVAGATLEEPATMHWPADVDEDRTPWFMIRVAVPFTYSYSKNAVWRVGKGGHVFLRKEAQEAKRVLVGRLKGAIAQAEHPIFHNRLWIDVMVEKPDHKGDAVNVVDTVCDAVQEATGLNDRWYSIRRLDWRVVKTNPRLIIGISQDETEDVQVCSYCGRCLPFDAFTSNKSTNTGRARTCRECDAAARKAKKAHKECCGSGCSRCKRNAA